MKFYLILLELEKLYDYILRQFKMSHLKRI